MSGDGKDGDVVVIDGGEREYIVLWSKVDHVLETREAADRGQDPAEEGGGGKRRGLVQEAARPTSTHTPRGGCQSPAERW